MIQFLISFGLLIASGLLAKVWFRLFFKPTYMREIVDYSHTALNVEKGYKLTVIGCIASFCFVMAIALFLEELARWPISAI